MTDASERIKSQNPDLYRIVAKNIAAVPDPRPLTVQNAYEEKWTKELAWERLLHELMSLGVSEEDTLLLEAIQNNTLVNEHHLTERLMGWIKNYPMITWSISLTNPTARRYVATAVGDDAILKTITSKQITLELIDHIRDSKTARLLRTTKGGSGRVSETFKTLQSAIRNEKFGRVWWIISGIDLATINIGELNYELVYVFEHHEDDEVTWSILEHPTIVDSGYFISSSENRKLRTPTKNFNRLLHVVWDDYLPKLIRRSETPIEFVSGIWIDQNNAYPYIDEGFAQYMIKTYLDAINTAKVLDTMENVLAGFIHPSYNLVWTIGIPHLNTMWKHNDIQIGEIALMAHNNGMDIIARAYADVFSTRYDPKEPNRDLVNRVGRREGFSWLFYKLGVKQQQAMLYGVKTDSKKKLTKRSNFGATLPAVYYETILHNGVDEEFINKTLLDVIEYNLKLANPDATRLKRMIEIVGKAKLSPIYSLVKNHKTAGVVFLSVVPSETIKSEHTQTWWENTSKETFKALVDILGYPSTQEVAHMMTYYNIEFLDAIPHEKLIEYANDGSFEKLSYEKRLKIAKKYALKDSQLFGMKFLERFLRREIYKAHISDVKDILEFAPDDLPWNDLLRNKSLYSHSESEEIIKILLARGADPAAYSSQALIQELSGRERPAIIRLLATEDALKNLSVTVKNAVTTILDND